VDGRQTKAMLAELKQRISTPSPQRPATSEDLFGKGADKNNRRGGRKGR